MLTVNRKLLIECLTEASRFCDPKSTMPILGTVRLGWAGAELLISSTDLNMSVTSRLPAESRGDVSVCVAPKQVVDLLKSMTVDEVRLDLTEIVRTSEEVTWTGSPGKPGGYRTCEKCSKKEHKDVSVCAQTKDCGGALLEKKVTEQRTAGATLLAGRGKYKLVGLPARDFPKLPVQEGLEWRPLAASKLRELVDGVYYAVSTDLTRAHLSSLLLESRWLGSPGGTVTPQSLVAVATDGHRLAKAQRPADGFMLPFSSGQVVDKTGVISPQPVRVLIPRDAVIEIRRHCGKGVETVEIAISKGGHLFFRELGGSAVYSMRLVDVMFPPYDQVIPRDSERFGSVARRPLVEALKRLLLVAEKTCGGVRWRWTQGEGDAATLSVETDHPDKGSASEELDARGQGLLTRQSEASVGKKGRSRPVQVLEPKTEAAPFIIGVNGKYVLEAISRLESDSVWIGMNGELDPIVVKASADSEDLHVVMPMRL